MSKICRLKWTGKKKRWQQEDREREDLLIMSKGYACLLFMGTIYQTRDRRQHKSKGGGMESIVPHASPFASRPVPDNKNRKVGGGNGRTSYPKSHIALLSSTKMKVVFSTCNSLLPPKSGCGEREREPRKGKGSRMMFVVAFSSCKLRRLGVPLHQQNNVGHIPPPLPQYEGGKKTMKRRIYDDAFISLSRIFSSIKPFKSDDDDPFILRSSFIIKFSCLSYLFLLSHFKLHLCIFSFFLSLQTTTTTTSSFYLPLLLSSDKSRERGD